MTAGKKTKAWETEEAGMWADGLEEKGGLQL